MAGSSHSHSVVKVWWRHHSICRQVERPHQVVNVNERVEFGHLFRLNDVTADPHYPRKKEEKHED